MALLHLLEEAQASVSRDRAGFLQAAARMMINCEQSALLGVPDKASFSLDKRCEYFNNHVDNLHFRQVMKWTKAPKSARF